MSIEISPRVIEALHDVYGEEEVSTSYSGRSMYGRTCLGYTGINVALFTIDIAEAILREENEDDDDYEPSVYDLRDKIADIGDPRSDSLGRGVIHYWPGLRTGEE